MIRTFINRSLQLTVALLFTITPLLASDFQVISIDQFADIYSKNPSIRLIDVRTPQEYTGQGHVKGTVLIPLQDIQSKGEAAFSGLNLKKGEKIYLICRSGNRSGMAAKLMVEMGYSNLVNIAGGTTAWISSGRPVDH